MVLHIGTGNHYLRGLSVTNIDALNLTFYDLTAMDALRGLPIPTGGTRSLYDHRRIVVGTEWRERFLLWPMGVPAPDAMHQCGTHATTFIGRRHFDDPHLINRASRNDGGKVSFGCFNVGSLDVCHRRAPHNDATRLYERGEYLKAASLAAKGDTASSLALTAQGLPDPCDLCVGPLPNAPLKCKELRRLRQKR